MKKVLLLLIMIFLMPIVTFASEATCTYKYEGVKLVINYKYCQKLTYNSDDAGNTKFGSIKGIEVKDIVDSNGNIACPNLYAKKSIAAQKKFKVDFNISNLEGYSKVNGELKKQKDDGLEKKQPNCNTHTCTYNKGKNTEYELTWTGSNLIVTYIGSRFNNYCPARINQSEWNATMFENGKCPDYIYDQITSRYEGSENCKGILIVSTKEILTEDDTPTDLDGSENVYDGTVNNNNNNNSISVDKIEECTSLLGDPETVKSPAWFLSIIFSIIRYVAIILLIVLTIIDFVGATASQDNDAIKKVVSKTIKRAIICVVIFVLPTLIDLVLQFIHDSSVSDCIKNI